MSMYSGILCPDVDVLFLFSVLSFIIHYVRNWYYVTADEIANNTIDIDSIDYSNLILYGFEENMEFP